MANVGGSNQFGSYQIQPAYGDVKKQTQLTKAAPISGAPYAAQALNTPRRSQRSAVRRNAGNEPTVAMPSETPTLPPERIYQQIAQIPGASETVMRIFGG